MVDLASLHTIEKLSYEAQFWETTPNGILVGVDEAGRGCLAGPVVAGAVVIPSTMIATLAQNELQHVNDSKQLTAKQRDICFELLTHHPNIQWGVGQASPEEIDHLNILRATHLAMRRAVEAITPLPTHALVDGLPIKGLPIPHTAIVKGDAKSLLVACASIIAKVTRDRLCEELDTLYPTYGFAQHKAYGTKAHLQALRQYGPCPAHRKTFAPVAVLQEELPLEF